MALDILKQGAEARLYLGDYKGEPCLIKERFVKRYRHPDLDTQITRQRMKAETKAATRCQAAGLITPRILHTDLTERKIYMEYFGNAITVKQYLQQLNNSKESASNKMETLCQRIGEAISKMHKHNVIHGDLTTSNMLINTKDGNDDYDLIFIDFGLSLYSETTEEKGVDLYVLERAILSTHSQQPRLFEHILNAYRMADTSSHSAGSVYAKLEEVRTRGRKRTMIG